MRFADCHGPIFRQPASERYSLASASISTAEHGRVCPLQRGFIGERPMPDEVQKVAVGLSFPEGPYQHPDGFLLVQQPRDHRIVRVGPNGEVETWVETPNAGTGGIVFNAAGYAFATGGNGTNQILRITPDLKVEPFVTDFEGHAFLGPNDLAIHASGHIFFSDPGTFVTAESNGGFYRSDFEGHTIRVAENLGFPNGVAVSADGRRVYVAETLTGLVKVFDVTEAGDAVNSSVFADVGRGNGKGGPDGMCVDSEGNLYAAIYTGGVVRVVSPEGQHLRDIPAGGDRPTNCCFGGPDLRTLYITESETGTLRSVPSDIAGPPAILP